MKLPLFKGLALSLLVCLATTVMVSCGKKGPVRPKLGSLPNPPADVKLSQQGQSFLLSWSVPQTNQDGSAVEDLSGFVIKRLVFDAKEGCPSCREPHDRVADIDLHYPDPAQRIADRIYWNDLDIVSGSGYRYAIIPLTVGKQEVPGATIHLVSLPPVARPQNLVGKVDGALARLTWQPPELTEGFDLIGYNVYRRHTERAFPAVPLNKDPIKETELIDRNLEIGRSYAYLIRAVVRFGEHTLESMPAGVVVMAL